MFKSKKYILQTKDKLFEICILLFIPRNKYILDISYEKGNNILVQCVSDNKLSYVSYVTDNSDETLSAANVLFNFMQNNNLLIPVILEKIVEYTVNIEEEFTLVHPIQYKTNRHIFLATIKENKESFYVKIGGVVFSGCMEIFIYENSISKLTQVFSEPECDVKFSEYEFNAIDAVEMIKGALQICQLLFDVNEFEFLDMSNIECDKSNYKSRKLPRSFKSPFSLTHLYLITHCKTWYEYHFNARLSDKKCQDKYEDNKNILIKPINIHISKLVKDYEINAIQLSKYYDASKSLVEIATNIPLAQRCELLRWVPNFLDNNLEILLRDKYWIIKLDSLSEININSNIHSIPFNMYKHNTVKILEQKKEKNSIINKCEKAIKNKSHTMVRISVFILTKNTKLVGGNNRPKNKRNKTRCYNFKKNYNKTHKAYYNFRFSNRHCNYRLMYN